MLFGILIFIMVGGGVKDIGKSASIEVAGNYEMLIKWIIFLTILKNSVIKKALKIGLYLFC